METILMIMEFEEGVFFLSIVVVYTHTMMECIVTCTNFLLFLFFFVVTPSGWYRIRQLDIGKTEQTRGDKRLRAGELLQRRTTFY